MGRLGGSLHYPKIGLSPMFPAVLPPKNVDFEIFMEFFYHFAPNVLHKLTPNGKPCKRSIWMTPNKKRVFSLSYSPTVELRTEVKKKYKCRTYEYILTSKTKISIWKTTLSLHRLQGSTLVLLMLFPKYKSNVYINPLMPGGNKKVTHT